MIKALLCDFDGTIANTIPLYVQAYALALHSVGIECTQEDVVKQCFGKTEKTICNNLGIPEKTDAFTQTYFSGVKKFSKLAQLFPGVEDILHGLKKREVKLAVLTFQYRWYIELMLPALGLEKLFDIIVSYDDVLHAKPAPDAVLKACEVFKIQTSDALMIGDTKSDVLMGKDAGAKTALFFPKEHESIYSFEDLKQTEPDFIVYSWEDMGKIVYE